MDINVIYGEGAENNAAPAGFYAALNYVVNYFDELFTNNVTININISYGAILDPYTGKYTNLNSSDLGASYDNNEAAQSYSAVDAALLAQNAPGASTLPAVSPMSGSLYMGSADAKALGLNGSSAALDGSVGIAAGTDWDFAPNSTPTAGEYYLIGVLEHEITEVMGRVSFLDSPGQYGVADLYRYSAPGIRSVAPGGNGSTAYFSIDNGATDLGTWNNQISNGDLADWYPQGPAPGGNDAFNDYSDPGVVNVISASDLTLMQAIGWSITPAAPSITTLVGHPVNGGTIEVQGTGQAGDTVTLYQGNTVVGSGAVAGNGSFDIITSTMFADGLVSLIATETDGADETSAASFSFNVDVNPNAPTLTAALRQPVNGGPIAVQGTGEPGDVVTLYQGNTVVGSGTVGSNGAFDVTTSASFADGVISLTATETNNANLTSAPSAIFDVTVALLDTDQVYEVVLQREPSSAEVTAALAINSTVGLSGVIASLVDSPEAQYNVYPVAQIIELATGSLSDMAGWIPYVESAGALQGQSQTNPLLDEMAEAFVASASFGKTYNGGAPVDPNAPVTDSIVSAIVQAATGIPATQTQIDNWVATGLSIDQIFVDFALGEQYTTHLQITIQRYLTTLADQALSNGGLGVTTTLTPDDGLTAAQVQGIYQAVLQRAPTSGETNAALSMDSTIGNVGAMAAIMDSPEAQDNVYPVVQIIELATDSLPSPVQLANWVIYVESDGLLQGQAQNDQLLDQMAEAFVASTMFGNTYNGGTPVDPNASITPAIVSAIIQAATGIAVTQTQIDNWVATGLSIDQVFVDFALGDQYTAMSQGTAQDYLIARAINGAGVTTVDGVNATGALALGTIATPLTGNDLTILGGSGTLTLVASGNAGTITELNTSTTGGTITANGDGDILNAANGANTITANGASDAINLGEVSTGTSITSAQTIHASGAGDTITFATTAADNTAVTWATESTVDGGNATTGIGANSTVKFGNNTGGGSETIVLTGDLTGATTQNGTTITGIAMTTLGNVHDAGGDLIVFNNAMTEMLAGPSAVNVSSATTLAYAFDIAAADAAASQISGRIPAGTGVVDWFQYGHDTYVLEAINTGSSAAADSKLAATDALIQIVGVVSLGGESLTGHTLTL